MWNVKTFANNRTPRYKRSGRYVNCVISTLLLAPTVLDDFTYNFKLAVQLRFLAYTLEAPEYNCSAHTPEEWTDLHGTPQTVLGLWSLTFATICQILYFPSLRVFYRERRMTCYKIMHFLALADFGGVTCVGSLFGYAMLQGLVYCSDVTFSWVMGVGVCCCWYVSTGTCALLVINRIGELLQLARYFQGWRSSLCMLIIFLYGIFVTLFTRLVYPNSPHTTVAFEPFIPGHTVEEYPNNFNMTHNICVAFVIPSLYIAYSLIVRWKASSFEASTITQKLQAQIFTQASIICFFNVTTAAAWIVQMFIPTPQFIITAGMITIQSVHGLPCIIYIVLNRNVRDELRRIIGSKPQGTMNNAFTSAVNPSLFVSTATAFSINTTVI